MDGQKDDIQWTLWTRLDNVHFADDLVLLSNNRQQMQNKTTSLAFHSSLIVLHIHPDKTKMLKIKTSSEAVRVGDNNVEDAKSFTYLGSQ